MLFILIPYWLYSFSTQKTRGRGRGNLHILNFDVFLTNMYVLCISVLVSLTFAASSVLILLVSKYPPNFIVHYLLSPTDKT